MSIASEISRIQGAKSDLKTSIEAKGVSVPDATKIDGYAALVDQISGGGGNPEAGENDVIFVDYDGTIRYSYSAADFANLTALPANPSHAGLTAQGWNWTLADAQSYVASYGCLVIGQMYVTDDGKTRLYIVISDGGRMDVPLHIYQSMANGVEVDWGDGGATETAAGTGAVTMTHTYAATGRYTITLKALSGTYDIGGGDGNKILIGAQDNYNRVYSSMLQRVEIGTSVTSIRSNGLQRCFSLSVLTIPTNVTTISSNALQASTALLALIIPTSITTPVGILPSGEARYVSLPKQVTSIGSDVLTYSYAPRLITLPPNITALANSNFYSTYSLAKLIIPNGVVTIGANFCFGCLSMSKITVPSSVTTIGNNFFQNCYGLKEVVMLPTTPPTLGTGAFTNCPADLVIYVPTGKLTAYQTTSNWSAYASQMVEM